jgi:hypothetical protein
MERQRISSSVIAFLGVTLLAGTPVWAQGMQGSMKPKEGAGMAQGMMSRDAPRAGAKTPKHVERHGSAGMMGHGMAGAGRMGGGMSGMGMQGAGMMAQGMMAQGMAGHGRGMRVVPIQHLSADDARHFLDHRLARRGNKRLKLGEVREVDDDTILADIVTVDDSLVRRLKVNRHSGRIGRMAASGGAGSAMKPMDGMESAPGNMSGAGMGGMKMPANAPTIPPVSGFSEGREVAFIHTETSDPKIAKILTDMMGGSPVLVVPALADAPAALTAPVYVFTNGKSGDGPTGPLGGQPDIFPFPPGDTGYRPLRAVNLVTWTDPGSARELRSAAELKKVIDSGAVTIKPAGVVVNMPFLIWPGGRR